MKSLPVLIGLCVVALAGGLGLVAACAPEDLKQVGEACEESNDCARDLECIQLDEQDTVCLPVPATRTPKATPCRLDGQCTLGSTDLWPVEAYCERARGVCTCDPGARTCGEGRSLSEDCLCVDD